jgi:FkbM family methyltransferase
MVKNILRRTVVDQLPATSQLLIIRNYFYWFKGDYIKSEVNLFRKLCDPKRNTLDIGANQGLYSMYLSRFSSHLYCFEPLPWLAKNLKSKFSGTGNVSVINCALGSKTETAVIHIPVTKEMQYDTRSSLLGNFNEQLIEGNQVVETKNVPVAVKRLDDFKLENIGFMKVDVEGFEVEVLKGGVETITRNQPNIYIEIEQKHHQDMPITRIFDFILSLGYGGYFRFEQKLLPIKQFNPDLHQAKGSDGVKGRYCGDFIFLPNDGPSVNQLNLS